MDNTEADEYFVSLTMIVELLINIDVALSSKMTEKLTVDPSKFYTLYSYW